jgi:hypothetical protein
MCRSEELERRRGLTPDLDEMWSYVAKRLLLDSRVVDMPMASTPNFVMLSSLKPLFFNGLKNALCFSDNAGA